MFIEQACIVVDIWSFYKLSQWTTIIFMGLRLGLGLSCPIFKRFAWLFTSEKHSLSAKTSFKSIAKWEEAVLFESCSHRVTLIFTMDYITVLYMYTVSMKQQIKFWITQVKITTWPPALRATSNNNKSNSSSLWRSIWRSRMVVCYVFLIHFPDTCTRDLGSCLSFYFCLPLNLWIIFLQEKSYSRQTQN